MCIVFVMLLSYVVWITHDCLNVVLCAAVVYYTLCAYIVLHYVFVYIYVCRGLFYALSYANARDLDMVLHLSI